MVLEYRLKSGLLVAAEIRRCEAMFASAVVVHRGDDERGQILIKHYVPSKGARIYVQSRDENGKLIWFQPLGEDWIAEKKADQYIERQKGFDEDLWVLEVEDAKNVYEPEF